MEDGQETVVDPEVEHEIEAVVAGLEPSEEGDAVEVLATWRSTRTSMTQENSTRGCLRPAGVVKLGSTAEAHKNALRQDLAQLSGRTPATSAGKSDSSADGVRSREHPDVKVELECWRSITYSDDLPCGSARTKRGPSVDLTVSDILPAHEN